MAAVANLLNLVFTRNSLNNLVNNGTIDLLKKVALCYNIEYTGKTVHNLYSDIYILLSNKYRNEYFFKNTLLNKLLLGVHNMNTSTALVEIPIANSKVDFVLVNDKAIAYEIKTELDNLERLKQQLLDYYKIFKYVYVVTSQNHVIGIQKLINELNIPVGVLVLTKRNTLKRVSYAKEYNKLLCKEEMFRVLRKREYEYILRKYNGDLPVVNQFMMYTACKNEFVNLPDNVLDREFILALKLRKKSRETIIKNIPYELRLLSYFMDYNQNDYEKLSRILKIKLE